MPHGGMSCVVQICRSSGVGRGEGEGDEERGLYKCIRDLSLPYSSMSGCGTNREEW